MREQGSGEGSAAAGKVAAGVISLNCRSPHRTTLRGSPFASRGKRGKQ